MQAQRPDVIVLDWMMPGLDGLGVLERLRAAGDRTLVLMLTARDAVESRVEGLEGGADDYLVKPFAPAELLRASTRCCGDPPSPSRMRRWPTAACDWIPSPGKSGGESGGWS